MANTLDPMDLKQIISLHLDGYSNRKIGVTLDISRNTVNSYMKRFKASEYALEELLHNPMMLTPQSGDIDPLDKFWFLNGCLY